MSTRGSRLDSGNRFTASSREAFDDGWGDQEDRFEVDPRTRILDDSSRNAFAQNSSPDIPFTHSINPYRGCEHGCSYCLDGETPILMADGSLRPLSDLNIGDRIYGTIRRGAYRRYAITEVLNHWTTVKPAFRITLADGTTLVASGDHRFLTERGWKFVSGQQQGSERRPHLTTGNKLMGLGGFVHSYEGMTPQYERGYLCGLIRGDGTLKTYHALRTDGGGGSTQRQFRLALKDTEPLTRTEGILRGADVQTTRFVFQKATPKTSVMEAIRSNTKHAFDTISSIIDWPIAPSREWHRGFLAGIFDAEGSYDGSTLRISNSDHSILKAIETALRYLGFQHTFDVISPGVNKPVHTVRVMGGMSEHLRFFHLTDPAIRRKRSIEGRAIKSNAKLDIVEIEPLNRSQELFDITTGTEDFIANGVVSHNCYARPTHEYLGFNAGIDFESIIMVKRDVARLARAAMMKRSWKPTTVSISGVTDAYQPLERKLGLTRGVLETMLDFRNPVGVVTKNAGVCRDIDLLAEMVRYDCAVVFLSITTLDADLAGRMEPRTSRPAQRLKAIERLAAAGIPVGVMVAPIIPGLTDEEAPAILAAAADAGARWAGHVLLRLPLSVKPVFLDWLDREEPARSAKVRNALREMKGETMNESGFKARMKGKGPRAEAIARLFRISAERAGMNREDIPLSTEHFRRPGSAEQLGLF